MQYSGVSFHTHRSSAKIHLHNHTCVGYFCFPTVGYPQFSYPFSWPQAFELLNFALLKSVAVNNPGAQGQEVLPSVLWKARLHIWRHMIAKLPSCTNLLFHQQHTRNPVHPHPIPNLVSSGVFVWVAFFPFTTLPLFLTSTTSAIMLFTFSPQHLISTRVSAPRSKDVCLWSLLYP